MYVFIALDIAHDGARHILFVAVGQVRMGLRFFYQGRLNKGWSACRSGSGQHRASGFVSYILTQSIIDFL